MEVRAEYVRITPHPTGFMDDWIVLSPNRWKLKKAIQIVNQTLNELKVEKHPDKTFIGRIAKGFDFLGYSFEPKGLSIAPKTLANFLERIAQLYEQGATVRRIGQYVRNWWRWVRAGVEISFVNTLIVRHQWWNQLRPPHFLFWVALRVAFEEKFIFNCHYLRPSGPSLAHRIASTSFNPFEI